MPNSSILRESRPWNFSRAELSAGLRWYTGDSRLMVVELQEHDIPQRRPSVGRVRGLRAVCQGSKGLIFYDLALKEPQGTTRAGMSGAGRREVSFYRNLADQVPMQTPRLMASHPDGEWLALSLLSGGREPERWTAEDYLLATDKLVELHDRFWNLGEDLKVFPWLTRPLEADLDFYHKAAETGIQRLINAPAILDVFRQDIELILTLKRLVRNGNRVAMALRKAPDTLIHGDYWPGNLYINSDGSLVAYDWQQAGIGPGILDLFTFVQLSLWWFDSMPVTPGTIIQRYRSRLAQLNGQTWKDEEWNNLWDYALLWTFLAGWIDVLATTPAPVLRMRYPQLVSLWLEPVRLAVSKHIPEASENQGG
jgi:hypothetical protein